MGRGTTSSEELKIRKMLSIIHPFINLLLLCLNSSIFKIHYTTGHFIPKKYLSLVSYDNRNLKISKSKKSEQYFRDKIEIFIRLFDEHFARHFESH